MSRLEQIEKMLAREPADVFLNFSLAMEYAKAGREDEALAQFGRVAEVDSNYMPAYFQRANLLVKLNRHEEARAAFESALIVARQVGDQHAAAEISEALSMLTR